MVKLALAKILQRKRSTAFPQYDVPPVASGKLQPPSAAPEASKSQSKRGRPSKSDQEVWTTSSTETLFTTRYVNARDEFARARNHAQADATWILVATLVNKTEDTAYTVTQYKDKWALYRDDRNTTGNVSKAAAPPCLELMLEHWAPNPGMQNTSLLDATTDLDDAYTDSTSTSDDNSGSKRNKRKKTNGECVEEGLRALAEGVKVLGAAMQTKADSRSDTALSQGVIASLGRQEEALKQQTAAINELIRTLRGDK
ncbi:hypothetical protein F444_10758 [Phytophthora nicotianae P1976]|uniref:Uncharacterized protein n=1 Tax=Phytophthora nicotianae P1976 TaxID=1317066 RepID=A0A081A359_PHYNI|nr:hypothetical protein F444_10758 [Phytophthora nicotianae P1976]